MVLISWVCSATANEPLVRETGSSGDRHDSSVVVFAQEEGAAVPLIGRDVPLRPAVEQMPEERCPVSEVPMQPQQLVVLGRAGQGACAPFGIHRQDLNVISGKVLRRADWGVAYRTAP